MLVGVLGYVIGNYAGTVVGIILGAYILAPQELAHKVQQPFLEAGDHTLGGKRAENPRATVADNLLMALYFFVLIAFAGMRFFRSRFTHPHINEVESGAAGCLP